MPRVWPRRFLAVPTSALRVDSAIASESPKGYSQRELQEIAATIPVVYDCISSGWSPADFAAARWSDDQRAHQLGETYAKLFSDGPGGAPLTASYDGTDLVVNKGNHRVRAARSIDVPVLPVWVSARSAAEIDRVAEACTRRIDREGSTEHRMAHELHGVNLLTERTVLREQARDPEGRERESHGPEIWR